MPNNHPVMRSQRRRGRGAGELTVALAIEYPLMNGPRAHRDHFQQSGFRDAPLGSNIVQKSRLSLNYSLGEPDLLGPRLRRWPPIEITRTFSGFPIGDLLANTA
jgi:hypothetical protein